MSLYTEALDKLEEALQDEFDKGYDEGHEDGFYDGYFEGRRSVRLEAEKAQADAAQLTMDALWGTSHDPQLAMS